VSVIKNLQRVVGAILIAGAITPLQAGQLPDYALASMLATKSKSLVTSQSNTNNVAYHASRSKSNRGSVMDPSYKEAQCGGVAIGNVRGGKSHKQVIVVISGNVINTGNQC
jgi:hypothetical protein